MRNLERKNWLKSYIVGKTENHIMQEILCLHHMNLYLHIIV